MGPARLRPIGGGDRAFDQCLDIVGKRSGAADPAALYIATRVGNQSDDVAAASERQPVLACDRPEGRDVDHQPVGARRAEQTDRGDSGWRLQRQRNALAARLQSPAGCGRIRRGRAIAIAAAGRRVGAPGLRARAEHERRNR
jgi:hypothetical protein